MSEINIIAMVEHLTWRQVEAIVWAALHAARQAQLPPHVAQNIVAALRQGADYDGHRLARQIEGVYNESL